MNKKYILLLLVSVFLFFSCGKNHKQSSSYQYNLVENQSQQIQFTIDPDIAYIITSLFYYKNNDGQEYVTFQNKRSNEIVFHCIGNPDLSFRLPVAIEGPNGVGSFYGYYIEDFNHIYVTTPGLPRICRIDTAGVILQKINYEKTDENMNLIPSFISGTSRYNPLIVIGNKFYITQATRKYLGASLRESPVSAVIDTLENTVSILPFFYADVTNNEDIYKTLGTEYDFSRCYNGSNFIYSFCLDENVYIISPDHKEIKKIQAKSKFIDKLYSPLKPDEMIQGAKLETEIAQYGNLIYDKYRNVYYRFSYPETEMGDSENYIEILRSGRKKFSIVILDENFNVIGETVFPEYTYLSNNMFINEDGLYIRGNHHMNPDFDEDQLTFSCFELKKEGI